MNCNELNGFSKICETNIGGISRVWIIPFDEINGYTYTDDNTNRITGYSSPIPITYYPNKIKSQYSASQNRGNYRFYDHVLNLNFSKMDEDKRDELHSLEGMDITVIFKDNNGNCWIMGQDVPCKMTSISMGTGVNLTANEYDFTITSTEKQHLRLIECPSDSCFTSIVVNELILSTFTIPNALTHDWAYLELTGDENQVNYNANPVLQPNLWLSDPVIYANDVQQLEQLFMSLGNVSSFLANISVSDVITINVTSDDTTFSLLNVDDDDIFQSVSQFFLGFSTNLSPNIQTSGTVIRFEDSNGLIFEEPYGTTLAIPNYVGNSESFSIQNLLTQYPSGTTFNLSLPDTQCSSLDFNWALEPQIEICATSNEFNYYKGNQIHMRIPTVEYDVNTPRFQSMHLNFFGNIFNFYEQVDAWHSDFAQFQSDLTLSLAAGYGVQNLSIVDGGSYIDIDFEVDGIDVDAENPFYNTNTRGFEVTGNTIQGFTQSYDINHQVSAPYPSLINIEDDNANEIEGENLDNILNNNTFLLDGIGVSQNQTIDNISLGYVFKTPYEYEEESPWTLNVDSESCLILPTEFTNEKCYDSGDFWSSISERSVQTLELACGTGSTILGSTYEIQFDNNDTNVQTTLPFSLVGSVTPSQNMQLLTNFLNNLEDFRVLHMDYSPVERKYRIYFSYSYIELSYFKETTNNRTFVVPSESGIYENKTYTFDGINKLHPLVEEEWLNVELLTGATDIPSENSTYGFYKSNEFEIESLEYVWANPKLTLNKLTTSSDNVFYNISFHDEYPNGTNAIVGYQLTGNAVTITTLEADLISAGSDLAEIEFVLFTNEEGWGYVQPIDLLLGQSYSFKESYKIPEYWGTPQNLHYIGDSTFSTPQINNTSCI